MVYRALVLKARHNITYLAFAETSCGNSLTNDLVLDSGWDNIMRPKGEGVPMPLPRLDPGTFLPMT